MEKYVFKGNDQERRPRKVPSFSRASFVDVLLLFFLAPENAKPSLNLDHLSRYVNQYALPIVHRKAVRN